MLTYGLIAAGALVLLFAAYDLRARLINRGVVRALVPQVQKMRALAHQVVSYRQPRADEPIPLDLQPLFDAADQELRAAGLTVLGDLMEIHPDGQPFGQSRWFVDESRTISGWFGVTRKREKRELTPVMIVFSQSSSGDFFLTARGAPRTALAQPPMIHRTYCEWSDGVTTTLGRHRAVFMSVGATLVEQPVTLEEAPAIVGRLRDTTARWRGSQPPADLLEQDVQALLGDTFALIGRQVIRALTAADRA